MLVTGTILSDATRAWSLAALGAFLAESLAVCIGFNSNPVDWEETEARFVSTTSDSCPHGKHKVSYEILIEDTWRFRTSECTRVAENAWPGRAWYQPQNPKHSRIGPVPSGLDMTSLIAGSLLLIAAAFLFVFRRKLAEFGLDIEESIFGSTP
jgi:hypothetical protein